MLCKAGDQSAVAVATLFPFPNNFLKHCMATTMARAINRTAKTICIVCPKTVTFACPNVRMLFTIRMIRETEVTASMKNIGKYIILFRFFVDFRNTATAQSASTESNWFAEPNKAHICEYPDKDRAKLGTKTRREANHLLVSTFSGVER